MQRVLIMLMLTLANVYQVTEEKLAEIFANYGQVSFLNFFLYETFLTCITWGLIQVTKLFVNLSINLMNSNFACPFLYPDGSSVTC